MNLTALKDLLIEMPFSEGDQSCVNHPLTGDPERVVLIHVASCFRDILLKFTLKFMQ